MNAHHLRVCFRVWAEPAFPTRQDPTRVAFADKSHVGVDSGSGVV